MKRLLYLAVLLLGFLMSGAAFEPAPLNPDSFVVDGKGIRKGAQPAPSAFVDGELAEDGEEGASTPLASSKVLVPRDQTRVAVLGYHNFSETKPVTEMLMRTSEFREQMEYIRKAGLAVISMQEFLEWRFGERNLPAECVLITLDDGWKSVYTDAFPILKEYGYPFTLFLYTKYLTGRGNSMSPAMVREMQQHGATIGSHSTSHYYPRTWKQHEAQGEKAYIALLDQEMGRSFEKLSSLFGPINTYCYPGGYITQTMLDRLPSYGYVAAFTVVPGKVTVTENPWQIHRYMVFGNDPSIFRRAMDFRVAQTGKAVSTGSTPGTLPGSTPPPPFPVYPQPDTTVPCEIPVISAQLSGVAGVDLSTVHMKVSGFGRVPAKMDAASRTIRWTPPCRIYMPNISVHITWNSSDGASHKAEWSFKVDQTVTVQQ